ncbi:DUF1456 family protein [Flavobacterium sp. ST-75]|uniref:DUF1456 family protein n=1 Tax=Flavobacterium rhizophilum TaxID=3163296 RepID=A0ABW8YD82_9FLAO
MNNNDIFKKLRVALQLRDDQIVEILQLVDFRISKPELGAFFRNENHPNYMECGDQVLRNFLNGLIIHLRGTKEEPKDPKKVLATIKAEAGKNKDTSAPKKPGTYKGKPKPKPKTQGEATGTGTTAKKTVKKFNKPKKKEPIMDKTRFKNGKKPNKD